MNDITASQMGRRGGLNRAKNLTRAQLSAIGKAAAAARWAKWRKAKKEKP